MANFRHTSQNRQNSFGNRQVAQQDAAFTMTLNDQQRILEDLERKLQQQRELANEIARRKEELLRLQNLNKNTASQIGDMRSNNRGAVGMPNAGFRNNNNNKSAISNNAQRPVHSNFDKFSREQNRWKNNVNNNNQPGNFRHDSLVQSNRQNNGRNGGTNIDQLQRFSNSNHWHIPNADRINVQHTQNYSDNNKTKNNPAMGNTHVFSTFNSNNFNNISSRVASSQTDPFYLTNANRNSTNRRRIHGHRTEVPFRNTENAGLNIQTSGFKNRPNNHWTNFQQGGYQNLNKMDNVPIQQNDNAQSRADMKFPSHMQERATHTKGFPLRKSSHFDRIWQNNVNDRNTWAKWHAHKQANIQLEPQIDHGAFQNKRHFAISEPFRKDQTQLTSDNQNAYQNGINSGNSIRSNGVKRNNSAVVLRYNNGQLHVRNDQIVNLQSHPIARQRNSQQTGRGSSAHNLNNMKQLPLQPSVPYYNEQYQNSVKPQTTVMNNPGAVHVNRHNKLTRDKTSRSNSLPRNSVSSVGQRQHSDFGQHITNAKKPVAQKMFSDSFVSQSDRQVQSFPQQVHQEMPSFLANTYQEQAFVNGQGVASQLQTYPSQNELVKTPKTIVWTRPNGLLQNSQPTNVVSNYNNVHVGRVQSNAGPLDPNKEALRQASEPVNVVLNNNKAPQVVARSNILPARANSNVAVQQHSQPGSVILKNNDAPPTFIRSNASPVNVVSHVGLPKTSQPVNVMLKNNDILPTAVKSNSHVNDHQSTTFQQISQPVNVGFNKNGLLPAAIGSSHIPVNAQHDKSFQQTVQTQMPASESARQLGNISPNTKSVSSQHSTVHQENQHTVSKQKNTTAPDIHATVAKLQQMIQTLHSKSQNKNLLPAAQQTHGISPVVVQTVTVSPVAAQDSNILTIGVNQNNLPVVSNLHQTHAPQIFGAGQVWHGGFNQFSPAVGASMWQQFMFGDSIDPPDIPDPTGTPVPGAEIEIEGPPVTTTTTTVATTKKPTTTTKRIVTTLAPHNTTKPNIIHSIALKLASLLGKTGKLSMGPNAKTRDKAMISSQAVKNKPLTNTAKKETEKSKIKVTAVENRKRNVLQNIIKVDAKPPGAVNPGKPVVVTVNKPPVTFLSGKPLKERKATQTIVNVAAADILNKALDPVLAGFKVQNVIAKQIGQSLNSNSVGALKLTQSGQQIASVRGDYLADVSKILSGETVTPSVSVDNTQLVPSVTIKQTPSVVNNLPLTNDNSNNPGVNDALIKEVYHETAPSTTMMVDKTVAPPKATDATSMIKSAVVDILSQIRHLWTSSDLATTISPTTTKTPCTPNSPEFTCKGLGPFAAVDSVGPWCVEKCKQNACVESVCECSCPNPQLGVAGWQGPTTESALGPLDRINTTDVPEEIEAVPDKTPAEGGRLRPGQRWRKREGWERRRGRRRRPGRRRQWKRHKWNRRQRRTTTQVVTTPEEEIEQEDMVTTTARTITTTVPMTTPTEAAWTSTMPYYDVTLNAYDVTMDSSKDYQLSTVVPIDTQKYKDEFKAREVRWGTDWRPRTLDRLNSKSVGPTSGYDILGVNPDTLHDGSSTGFIPDIERTRWGRQKSKNPQGGKEPDDDDESECTCANERKPPPHDDDESECTCATGRKPLPQWNRRQTTERSWRAPPSRDGWRNRGRNSGPLSSGRDWHDGPSPTDQPWGRDNWRDSRRGRGRWRDPPPVRESGPPTGWDPRDQWIPPDRHGDRRRFGLRDRWRESTTKANEEENEANDKKK